ncbi:MAG: phosphotransferase [Caldilineaceae bacterium]|nr:phosphotransferase [Caldilineaceae bacterium]
MAELSLPANLAEVYGLRSPIEPFAISQGSNSLIVGVHTGDGDFLWKRYQPFHVEESIRYEHRLLTWLTTRELSFVVPAPLPDIDGDTLWTGEDGSHALFPFIPGSPSDDTKPRHLENVGAALAELHAGLAAYPTTPRPAMPDFGSLAAVHGAITNPGFLYPRDLGLPDSEPFASLLAWWREEVAALETFLGGPFRALPRQVIHGDYSPVNTLCVDDRLTGIVDFEFAGPEVRALDVASGLYFSLRVWKGDDLWPRGEAFLRGYTTHTRLTPGERSSLPWLMRLRNAVSKIFWLGKAQTDGTTEKQVLYIGESQMLNRWLAQNSQRLDELLEA